MFFSFLCLEYLDNIGEMAMGITMPLISISGRISLQKKICVNDHTTNNLAKPMKRTMVSIASCSHISAYIFSTFISLPVADASMSFYCRYTPFRRQDVQVRWKAMNLRIARLPILICFGIFSHLLIFLSLPYARK